MSSFFDVESLGSLMFLPEVQVHTPLLFHPRKSHETLRKVRAKNHTTAIFVLFSSQQIFIISLFSVVVVPIHFCLFSLLTRLAKLFSSLGHTVSVIMFIDTALSPSFCFGLSARRNSFRFKSDQISFY